MGWPHCYGQQAEVREGYLSWRRFPMRCVKQTTDWCSQPRVPEKGRGAHVVSSCERWRASFFFLIDFTGRGKEREKEERERSTFCSTYWYIHWLIPVCALIRDQTSNFGVSERGSNQLFKILVCNQSSWALAEGGQWGLECLRRVLGSWLWKDLWGWVSSNSGAATFWEVNNSLEVAWAYGKAVTSIIWNPASTTL